MEWLGFLHGIQVSQESVFFICSQLSLSETGSADVCCHGVEAESLLMVVHLKGLEHRSHASSVNVSSHTESDLRLTCLRRSDHSNELSTLESRSCLINVGKPCRNTKELVALYVLIVLPKLIWVLGDVQVGGTDDALLIDEREGFAHLKKCCFVIVTVQRLYDGFHTTTGHGTATELHHLVY